MLLNRACSRNILAAERFCTRTLLHSCCSFTSMFQTLAVHSAHSLLHMGYLLLPTGTAAIHRNQGLSKNLPAISPSTCLYDVFDDPFVCFEVNTCCRHDFCLLCPTQKLSDLVSDRYLPPFVLSPKMHPVPV
jgi:hypothetical protein